MYILYFYFKWCCRFFFISPTIPIRVTILKIKVNLFSSGIIKVVEGAECRLLANYELVIIYFVR